MSTAMVVRDATELAVVSRESLRLMRPIASPADVIEAQNATRQLVHEALVENRDFGKVPGTDKNTLLKPGAERVALAFGCLYGEPRVIEKEIDHDRINQYSKVKWVTCAKPAEWQAKKAAGVGRNKQFDGKWVWQERTEENGTSYGLYRYMVAVDVIERATGRVVGSAVGACSTMESKYIDRPRDSENTVLKMAHKRAMVAACLVAFGLSDEFTQDAEDLPHLNGEATQEGSRAAAPEPEPEPEPEPAPPPPLTLDVAAAMPLPGAASSWGNKGGKPLGELSTKMLERVAAYLDKKIAEGGAEGREADPDTVRLRDACVMIIAARAIRGDAIGETKSEAKPEAKPEAKAEPSTAGVNADGSTAPGAPIAAALEPKAGARPLTSPEDGEGSVVKLTKRITQLLENGKLTDDELALIRGRLAKASDTASLLELLADAEAIVGGLPF